MFIDKGMDELECFIAMKINEIASHAWPWMNLRNTKLGERGKLINNIYSISLYKIQEQN